MKMEKGIYNKNGVIIKSASLTISCHLALCYGLFRLLHCSKDGWSEIIPKFEKIFSQEFSNG